MDSTKLLFWLSGILLIENPVLQIFSLIPRPITIFIMKRLDYMLDYKKMKTVLIKLFADFLYCDQV